MANKGVKNVLGKLKRKKQEGQREEGIHCKPRCCE